MWKRRIFHFFYSFKKALCVHKPVISLIFFQQNFWRRFQSILFAPTCCSSSMSSQPSKSSVLSITLVVMCDCKLSIGIIIFKNGKIEMFKISQANSSSFVSNRSSLIRKINMKRCQNYDGGRKKLKLPPVQKMTLCTLTGSWLSSPGNQSI